MSKRNTKQRRHLIVQRLMEQGDVSVDELSAQFDISEVTIRKDLAELEKNGLLLRRYGGAVSIPLDMLNEETSLTVSPYKLAIAREAIKLIRDHNRIILDSGSTTAALIPLLEQKRGLVVMTNSLQQAKFITELEYEPTLLMTGGTWDPHSEAFQGRMAEKSLLAYDFDQLFIGADSLDLVRGTTTFKEIFGLSRIMAQVSREVIVMIESKKIGRKIPNVELEWGEISHVISDEKLDLSVKKCIEEKGIQVICAKQ